MIPKMVEDNESGIRQDGALTPKQKARDLILDALETCISYWQEKTYETDRMTPKELYLTQCQLVKESNRIAGRFNSGGWDAPDKKDYTSQ